MTKKRWNRLMGDWDEELTPGEMRRGWHFCDRWDGLLVGPGMPEFKVCRCREEKE